LPPAYEWIVANAGALATSGAAALKSYRSDSRMAAIRAALSKTLLGVGVETAVTLGKQASRTSIRSSGKPRCCARAG
jgi:hypothetical protein